MATCHLPLSWSLIAAHTSLASWPLENALRAFIGHPSIASFPPKQTWAGPTGLQLMPTLTSLHDPGPTLRLVATAWSAVIIASLVCKPPTKPEGAVLSETTILRIHEMASRQPYPMPPDDGGDEGAILALPFAQNPRKQSLFIFWLFLLLVAGAAAYFFSPLWMAVVSRHIAEQHGKLSWAVILISSTILANISDPFCQFGFFLWSAIRLSIETAIWTAVTLLFKPVATAHSASQQVMRIAHYLSRWYLRIPLDLPLPQDVDRSTTLMSSAVSVVGGYHLIGGRVARTYMLVLKSMVEQPVKLVHLYSSLRDAYAPIVPTHHFQSWAWWAIKHILAFMLGELSWRSISWSKLFIIPPRSHLQLAIDPIQREQRRQAVEQADIKRLVQKLVANAGLGSGTSASDSPSS
ncbi:hypothetical protein B0H17DRAFT_1084176 [Mycena rosella]|uniref:Transmembrane protein n=1 Tax=Mycena rosella TaxID=1033263 RepID=A0AAD7D1K1_MYCRO|nr:hypothetical protein B0H17DRAFT_1084176 [Mycena rosella]